MLGLVAEYDLQPSKAVKLLAWCISELALNVRNPKNYDRLLNEAESIIWQRAFETRHRIELSIGQSDDENDE